MFDENQIVQVRWTSSTKKYYQAKGYQYTKMLDVFDVVAKDLMPKSSVDVVCVCDYCGRSYQTHYSVYKKSAERGKIACLACKDKKLEDSFISRYNAKSVGASKQCQEAARAKMVEKYGKAYALQTDSGQRRFRESMCSKYGVDNPSRHEEIHKRSVAKMVKTQCTMGIIPVSKPERAIVQMLQEHYGCSNCFPSYVVDRVILDCLLMVDDVKIDVEYDGMYWHKDRINHDRKRNHWLISQGYKILRIKGNNRNSLPSIEDIVDAVNLLLEGHNLTYIDMNKEQLR